ncbi:uncharacterized protein LOC144665241 [Oculina patagonica]
MDKEELLQKLQEEKRLKRNAQRREAYLREKINVEMLEFDEADNADFNVLFQKIPREKLNDDQLLFWEEQDKALRAKGARGHRWHPKIIRLCLSIWNRSPEAYHEMATSGMLRLPSGRLLQYYKNSVSQNSGLNEDVLQWMEQEAEKLKLTEYGKCGGIILDEMSIQEDLQMKKVNGCTKLIGLVSLGQEHEDMNSLCLKGADKEKVQLASHVLQFVFLGHTGFRFPFAHWPTKEVDPAVLYIHFWKSVYWLLQGGFSVHYCCCDGGSANRSFIKLHFSGKDPHAEKFTTVNPYTREPLVFLMDPYHNFKKLRNNIEKSKFGGVRHLRKGSSERHIEWQHFKSAYQWDQNNSTLKIHERLTEEHFSLGYANKMRNHLATDVLNENMLFLMKAYKNSLGSEDGTCLDLTIELLETSSKLIEIFEDPKPVQSMSDSRLNKIDACLNWLQQWEKSVLSTQHTIPVKNKMMLSDKLRFDLASMLVGFRQLSEIVVNKFPGSGIVPARTNSNIIENVFCQQRGRNGQNDNPNYNQYCSTMNGIILGQHTTTKKSNTGNVDSLSFFTPTRLVPKKH